MQFLKRIKNKALLNPVIRVLWNNISLLMWEISGKPVPPPHSLKQKTISDFQKKFKIDVFFETGTYLGLMVEAQKNNFQKIYSVELSDELFLRAKKIYKTNSKINLLNGDSGKILKKIVPTLDKKTLFWLDAHYSGGITAKGEKECPIFEELEIILTNNLGHVILIDDARLFTGSNDYPTVKALDTFIKDAKSRYSMQIKNDIISLIPL